MDAALLILLPVTTFQMQYKERKEITMRDHMEKSRKGAYLIDSDLSQHLIFFCEIIHICKG